LCVNEGKQICKILELYGIVSCHASIDDKEDLDQHFREEFGGVTRNILTTFCGQRNVTIAIKTHNLLSVSLQSLIQNLIWGVGF